MEFKVNLENNSLKKEIEDLIEICDKLEEDEKYGGSTVFREPATEEMLKEWEEENGIILPEEYKDFLRFTDGARINSYTALFVSVVGIRANFVALPPEYVLVGDYGGYGALMCFEKATGEFLTYERGRIEHYGTFRNLLLDIIESCRGVLGTGEPFDLEETVAKLREELAKIREEEKKKEGN